MIKLRDYQAEAIAATRQAWARGVRRPAIVLPTGAGKTVVFSHVVTMMRELGVTSVILAHRDELIEQAAAKLRAVAPDLRVGIWKADRREWRGRDVVVASVQSLSRAERRAELACMGARLVIVDECHHAVANTYMAVLEDLGCFEEGGLESGAAALGVTATLGRTDRVRLDQVWQEVAYQRSILDMIGDGYLTNAKGLRVKIEGLDLSGVRRSRGDWQDGALAEAMHEALAPKAIARAYVEHASDRRGIVFAPTVALAHEIAEAFAAEGITAAGVDGGMSTTDRRRVLADFSRGDLQVVTNCMVLTEGYDAPWCSCVVIARPTSSAPLYIQMAGRGLRPAPGKADCLIMDVVGVTGKHRLASVVDLAGADRVEKLPPELAEYDEIDLFAAMQEPEKGAGGPAWQMGAKDGPLVAEIVDLFSASRRSWLRTARGVWFLPAGKGHMVFLAPGADVGAYRVGICPNHAAGGEWLREGVDLEMAMSIGEQRAAREHGYISQRSASWRKGQPGSTQLDMARRMGVEPGAFDRGELSDAISVAVATQRLDHVGCMATVTERGYW